MTEFRPAKHRDVPKSSSQFGRNCSGSTIRRNECRLSHSGLPGFSLYLVMSSFGLPGTQWHLVLLCLSARILEFVEVATWHNSGTAMSDGKDALDARHQSAVRALRTIEDVEKAAHVMAELLEPLREGYELAQPGDEYVIEKNRPASVRNKAGDW